MYHHSKWKLCTHEPTTLQTLVTTILFLSLCMWLGTRHKWNHVIFVSSSFYVIFVKLPLLYLCFILPLAVSKVVFISVQVFFFFCISFLSFNYLFVLSLLFSHLFFNLLTHFFGLFLFLQRLCFGLSRNCENYPSGCPLFHTRFYLLFLRGVCVYTCV